MTDLIKIGKEVFSAAFVAQGGTQHINEQYPSFWAKIFNERDFKVFEFFRPQLWSDPNVKYCYQKNMFLYVNRKCYKCDQLLNEFQIANWAFMDVMRPEIYLNEYGRDAIKGFKTNILRAFKQHV